MLGTCLSSFSFILVSSIFGMPISGTHTVIGALIGAGLAGLAASSMNWTKFEWTVASWFISPIISSILAGLLFLVICSTTLGGSVKNTFWKMMAVTWIAACFLCFSSFMIISVAVTGTPDPLVWEITLPLAFLIGLFGCRLCLVLKASSLSQEQMSGSEIFFFTLAVWNFNTIIEREPKVELDPKCLLQASSHGSAASDDGETATLPNQAKKVYEISVVNFAY